MSKINEFRAIEARIAQEMERLEKLKQDKGFQKDMEFGEKLQSLMSSYGKNVRDVISILSPDAGGPAHQEKTKRKARVLKVYVHPDTDEIIETKGGNHKLLKSWKQKFGEEKVESWRQD